MKLIAKEEKLKVEEKAFFAMARGVEGSMRDALSLLDQLIAFSEGDIGEKEVNAVLGMVDEEILFALVEAMIKEDSLSGLKLVDTVISQGKDIRLFATNLIQHFRNMMMLRVGGEAVGLVELPEDSIKRMENHCKHFSLEEMEEAINTLSQTAEALKWTESGRIPLELAVIKLTKMKTVPAVPEGNPKTNPVEPEPAPVREIVPEKNPPENEPIPVSEVVPGNSPAEKDEGTALSLEKVKEKWPRVLECIRDKKITAEAYLREGRPTKVSEKMLTVTFSADFKFHKESIERNDIRRVIEGVLRDVFRHDLRIHPVLERSSSSPRNNTAPTEAKTGEDELNRLLDKEPIIKAALDTFGAKVAEVKKI